MMQENTVSMNHHQRILVAINHQPVDRFPPDFGSVPEVWHIKRTLGKDGTGLVIAPCYNIKANTPIENIIGLYETANE